jgi:NADH-quinone oxidoreductase subunit C
MSISLQNIADHLNQDFGGSIKNITQQFDELTLEVNASDLHKVCLGLRDNDYYSCEQLIDICGVDYSLYGQDEISEVETDTDETTSDNRFAVVYHLLSIKHNRRIRLRAFVNTDLPVIDSVVDIWNSANWFEREAFDLFGIIFEGHPDLRRILTDYGFVGYPFRKDFPISGHVETRYEPRELTPRVIREDGFGG